MASELAGIKVAILAGDMVEEAELTQPRQDLDQAGAKTTLIGPKPGRITSANHFEKSETYPIDLALDEADPADFDALLIPGGALNVDALRMNVKAQDFARAVDADAKPIAVICHGAWLLISAGLVRERRLTSFHTIQDDIRNAGGYWVDTPAERDLNWVSSRHTGDIAQFNDAMVGLFADLTHTISTTTVGFDAAQPAFRESVELDENSS
jgi:protease I